MVAIKQQLLIDVSGCRMRGISSDRSCVYACVHCCRVVEQSTYLKSAIVVVEEIALVSCHHVNSGPHPTGQSLSKVVLYSAASRDVIGCSKVRLGRGRESQPRERESLKESKRWWWWGGG